LTVDLRVESERRNPASTRAREPTILGNMEDHELYDALAEPDPRGPGADG